MVLIIILILIALTAVGFGFVYNVEARQAAEYEVRRELGELTPEEIRAEAMEERAMRDHIASKYSAFSD